MRKFTSFLFVLFMAMVVKAQTTTETYDFYTYAKSGGELTATGETVTCNGYTCAIADYITDGTTTQYFNGRIAYSTASNRNVGLRTNNAKYYSLYYYGSKGGNVSICNLISGDKVTIFGSALTFASTNVYVEGDENQTPVTTETAVVSGTTYIVIGEEGEMVQIHLYGKQYSNITKLIIETQASEKISAPTYTLVDAYDTQRTVEITPGVGSGGTAAAETFYTTDSTDPSNTNGTLYTSSFTVRGTTTIKAISYLPDGTSSEISEFLVEAETAASLDNNVVKVTGLVEGENGCRNVVIDACYNNDNVIGDPTVSITCTFNGTKVELPYTVKEDGTLVASVSADGYASAEEEIYLYGAYEIMESIDFSAVTEENITTLLDDTWTYKGAMLTDQGGNDRWSNWQSGVTYYYATSSSKNLTDFLVAPDNASILLVGFGVGRNVAVGRKHTISMDGLSGDEIALYVIDQSYNKNEEYKAVEYASAYMDDPTMPYTVQGSNVLAKVSVYTPIRELVVTDGEDFAPEYDYYTSATYTRSIAAGAYGTICLPFAPDAASLEAYNFYELTASTVSGTDGEVTFTKVAAPEANKPYIYCLADKDATEAPAITGGAAEVSTEAGTTIISDWQMVGSFKAETVDCTDKAIYALNGATQKLMKVTQSLSVPAYRAYIEGTSSQLNLQMLTVRISGPTGIEQISAADVEGLLPATIYDLMGRPVQNPQKGHLYIQGGKKTIY